MPGVKVDVSGFQLKIEMSDKMQVLETSGYPLVLASFEMATDNEAMISVGFVSSSPRSVYCLPMKPCVIECVVQFRGDLSSVTLLRFV